MNSFLRSIIDFYFLKKIFIIYNDGKFNFWRRKKIKDVRNLFRLKQGIKGIKDIVLSNIEDLSECEKEEENYYKPIRVNNFWSNNYIEYKTNGNKVKWNTISWRIS